MSEIANGLLLIGVVALIVLSQFKARRIADERRWWVLPVVLAFVAAGKPDLLGDGQTAGAAALLAVDLVLSVAMGALFARTTEVWRADDGAAWTKGTRLTLAVWAGGIAARAGLYGIGAAFGVRQSSAALVLGLSAMLLARAGVLQWRTRTYREAVGFPHAAWKDHM
ncbi:DUF1453 domain-containing protein [Streptomyces sp. TRM66268-LWL]|uniref:DUF1453 domain-containing protein n=1 Tax=Streptomyces polyasparticus TaxID=2767826 RepID=A0ABR7SSE1_9ACTN|nr:DUF1453 domain-containing protein [Streptomyces polyasparticus]MBC9718369.1 DUF1453 domain-containing protein [Streptomyces polyasparticus]